MNVTCQLCGETKTVNCTQEQYNKWKAGELIQRAMPNVPPDERELLISGTCGTCFDNMFPEED